MTRRAKLALISAAALCTGWGLEWAYYTVGPTWFCIGIASAAVLGLCAWLVVRLVPLIPGDGKHADKRAEETAPPWAGERPAGIAHEPAMPPEMLAAPVAAPAWAGPFAAIDPYVTGQPGLPVPEVTHDEFAPAQSWDGVATAYGTILAPSLAVALAVAWTLRRLAEQAIAGPAGQAEAEIRRLRSQVQQLKDERDFPALARQWMDDTGSFTRKDAELVAAMDAETAAGAR
jgi:hypothetical protein